MEYIDSIFVAILVTDKYQQKYERLHMCILTKLEFVSEI